MFQKINKILLEEIGLILLLILINLSLQLEQFTSLPSGIHAWAQTDHYAIALQYKVDPFSFPEAKTFVVNKQFPSPENASQYTSKTSTDLAFSAWISGVLMHLFSSNHIIIFRIVTFIFTLIGMLYLFRFCRRIFLLPSLMSFFIVLTVYLSPVYLYYSISTLPGISALNLMIVAMYYYFLFVKDQKNKYVLLFISIAFLAVSMRTPMIIALLALSLMAFLSYTKKIKLLMPFGILFLFFGLYQWYKMSNYQQYGSIFLQQLMYSSDKEEIYEIIRLTYQNWIYHYFTQSQFFVLCSFTLLASIIMQKDLDLNTNIYRPLVRFLNFGLILFGIYFFVMIKQFEHHDYYFLDTFFILLIFYIVLLAALLNRNTGLWQLRILFVVSMGFFFYNTQFILKKRNAEEMVYYDKQNHIKFQNIQQELKQTLQGLDQIAFYPVPYPNYPWVLLNQEGYSYDRNKSEAYIRKEPWKYILMDKSSPAYTLKDSDSLFQELRIVKTFEAISLYERTKIK